jgi:hypothetical protein
MTTDIRVYAALVRRALPKQQVPETFSDQFYETDRAYILDLQKKINYFIRSGGMREVLGLPENYQLQETGVFHGETEEVLGKLIQKLPTIDAKKHAEAAALKYMTDMARYSMGDDGFGIAYGAGLQSERDEKEINSWKSLVPTLQSVVKFHTDPNSDYVKTNNNRPIIGFKNALQAGNYTYTQISNENLTLPLNNNVNDWQFAYATKKYCQNLQEMLNKADMLTGMPQMPVTGENLPAMHEAMEALLKHPQAREIINQFDNFDKFKRTWEQYKQITPQQHQQMNAALDQATQRFINIYHTARVSQEQNDGEKDLPDVKRVDPSKPYGTWEQSQLATIEKFMQQNSPDTIRGYMKDGQPGNWDGVRGFFGGTVHNGVSDADIDFAIKFGGHFLEARQLRQAQFDRIEKKQDFVPPTTPEGRNLYNLQRHLLTKSTEIYGAQIGFYESTAARTDMRGRTGSLHPRTLAEYQQMMMLKQQDAERGIVPVASPYDTPMYRVTLNGTLTNDLALAQNVTNIMTSAQMLVARNLSNPALLRHMITAETGFSIDDIINLKPGAMNPENMKLLRKLASFPGLAELEGVSPELRDAIKMTAALNDSQLRTIGNISVAKLAEGTEKLSALMGVSFTKANPPLLTSGLSESYAMGIEQYHRLVRGKADLLARLYDQRESLPEEAKVIITSLAAQLKQQHPDKSDYENLKNHFANFPPAGATVDFSRLTGSPTDPTAMMSRLVLAIPQHIGAQDKLMQASHHIKGLNDAVAVMSPAQRMEMERLLIPHLISKNEPLITEIKQFMRANLADLNKALPADKQIPANLAINGDFRDPAFIRAFNNLTAVDEKVLLSGTLDKLKSFRERAAMLMPYMAPRMLAFDIVGQAVRFESDEAAIKAMPLLTAKNALSKLSENKIFTGIPGFNAANNLLSETESGFVMAYDAMKKNLENWMNQIPAEIVSAAALTAEQVTAQMNNTINTADPEAQLQFRKATATESLSLLAANGIAITAQDLRGLPQGSFTINEQGLSFDPAKIDQAAMEKLYTVLTNKVNALPAEAKQQFEQVQLQLKVQIGAQMGMFSEAEQIRMSIGSAAIPPQAALAALADAARDPRFINALPATINGMPKEEYLKQLREGTEHITAITAAFESKPELMATLDTAVRTQARELEAAQRAERARIEEAERRYAAATMTPGAPAGGTPAPAEGGTPGGARLTGNFALQVASLPAISANGGQRTDQMREQGGELSTRNGGTGDGGTGAPAPGAAAVPPVPGAPPRTGG